ncbi:MAG: FAS1-like dehydratase domain-containing protein [Nocardioidaceae bacterium]
MSEAFRRLEAAVGWEGPERVDTVERRHLSDFLAAIGETEGEVPPTFLACFLDEPPVLEPAREYGEGWLNGGDRFEYLAPVHVGDTLRSRAVFTGVVEKAGRSTTMAILTFVTDFRLPGGAVAVRHTGTRIRR